MIYHIHLVNGHQLLAEISNKSTHGMEYNCINPLMISYITNDAGRTFMILRPYILNYLEETVGTLINKSHVVSIYPVDKDFDLYYQVSLKHNKDFVDDISKKSMKDVMQSILSNYIEKAVVEVNNELPASSSNNTLH